MQDDAPSEPAERQPRVVLQRPQHPPAYVVDITFHNDGNIAFFLLFKRYFSTLPSVWATKTDLVDQMDDSAGARRPLGADDSGEWAVARDFLWILLAI